MARDATFPSAGVRLARLKIVISNNIGVDPRAILAYAHIEWGLIDADFNKARGSVVRRHASTRDFSVGRLPGGSPTIAASFWSKPVRAPVGLLVVGP